MTLNPAESLGLEEWLNSGISYREAAALLGVTHSALARWRKGSGMHPAQHAALLKMIQPFIRSESASPQPPQELIRPSLRETYQQLCALEDSHAPMLPLILHSIKTCPQGDFSSTKSPRSVPKLDSP